MRTVKAKIDRAQYKTIFSDGTHQLIGDEPGPYGTDLGTDPYSMLLMSLGGCVAMTVRMYADRKNWELEGVEVTMTQERVHSRDCVDCESTDGYVHFIEKRVELFGNLDEKQRERLMEIAEKCPVHKTLSHEIKIHTIATT